jgi:hypothetical protein
MGPRAPDRDGNKTVAVPSFIEIGPWGPELPIGPTIFAKALGEKNEKIKRNSVKKVTIRRFLSIYSPFRLNQSNFYTFKVSTK